MPAGCVVRSSTLATATSSIAWNNLLGSGAADICFNAETSSSHWLCNRGQILPSFLYCCHRHLSIMTLHHIFANLSTGPNIFLRVDRAISSNLMVTDSKQWVLTNLCTNRLRFLRAIQWLANSILGLCGLCLLGLHFLSESKVCVILKNMKGAEK